MLRLARSIASIQASAGLACAGLVATLVLVGTDARAASSLEGTWSAGPLSELVTVTSWVDECGAKPKSGGGSSGSYVVTASGDELVFSGTPPFRTDLCWERGPVRRVSHSTNPVARTWKTRCESNPGDVRKATITTQVSASSDDVIVLSEKAHYEVTVASGTCAADVERSRAWRIVSRAGASTATVTTTSATATDVVPSATGTATARPSETKRCETVGDAAAVDVRPRKRSIRAGESTTFTAHVVDAKGCDVGARATFRASGDGATSALTVDPSGKISVAAGATPATYAIVAEASGHSAKVDLEIVSEEKYLQLLDAGAAGDLAAASSIDGEATASSPPSVVTPTNADDGSTKRLGVAALGSGIVLLLAVAGIAVMRKSKPKPVKPPARVRVSSKPSPVVAVAPRVASERVAEPMRPASDRPPPVDPIARAAPRPRVVGRADFAKQTMVGGPELVANPAAPKDPIAKVCPTCGLGYPARGEFCSEDGARLVPIAGSPTKRCATCGRTFESSALFCPSDGSGLVPM